MYTNVSAATFIKTIVIDAKLHFRTDREKKQNKCEICSVTFGQFQTLKLHFRFHSVEKPSKCEVYSATFSLQPFTTFEKHYRIHDGDKS